MFDTSKLVIRDLFKHDIPDGYLASLESLAKSEGINPKQIDNVLARIQENPHHWAAEIFPSLRAGSVQRSGSRNPYLKSRSS